MRHWAFGQLLPQPVDPQLGSAWVAEVHAAKAMWTVDNMQLSMADEYL